MNEKTGEKFRQENCDQSFTRPFLLFSLMAKITRSSKIFWYSISLNVVQKSFSVLCLFRFHIPSNLYRILRETLQKCTCYIRHVPLTVCPNLITGEQLKVILWNSILRSYSNNCRYTPYLVQHYQKETRHFTWRFWSIFFYQNQRNLQKSI